MASSHNIIVYTCYKIAFGNANTPMGSNIGYFRDKYGIELNSLSKNITNLVSEPNLSTEQLIVIQHLRDLLDIKNNACTLDSFSEEDIDMFIERLQPDEQIFSYTMCKHLYVHTYNYYCL